MIENLWPLFLLAVLFGGTMLAVTHLSGSGNLDGIKSKTVGDGQHGTARWITDQEIKTTYRHVLFCPQQWRKGEALPTAQGIILGSMEKKGQIIALVDSDDIHCLMIAASGAGKTAFFLYPNLEYACACGMSFFTLDTKGDLARNYGAVARDSYGYNVIVIDLRNPTRSDGFNFLDSINRYMDKAKALPATDPKAIEFRAKAEKYANILSDTIINPDGKPDHGQNAYFYDAAEGLLSAMILLLAEFMPTKEVNGEKREVRHIVSVFKLIQALSGKPGPKDKPQFQTLMELLPEDYKAKWFAGSAVSASEQTMASVISTVLSRMIAFLDSEMEQVLCFDNAIDAERFVAEKTAVFLILPEEDKTKNFMASLMIQNLSSELFYVADIHGGALPKRVLLFCDEFGTMPAFDVMSLFSAGRSRKVTMVPIIQSMAQLEKNYGKEGSQILAENCQDTIYGGFAPQSRSAEDLSKALGTRTVLSGSVSKGKGDSSQTLQMMERPLMTPDELRALPKGTFIVLKTGVHPMRTRLRLFLDWGITFDKQYQTAERGARKVSYASLPNLIANIKAWRYPPETTMEEAAAETEGTTGKENRTNQKDRLKNKLKEGTQ